jgi:DNA polymerase III epsilon subunit-like protein
MLRNYICVRDYETGSKNKYKTQPIQIGAVMIDPKKLEVVEDSLFVSSMRPILDDKEAVAAGFDPIEDEALKVNGFTREELEKAPETKLVWQNYLSYLEKYNLKGKGGNNWNAPVVGGFNNSNFDDVIDIRMCEKYGPKLDDWGGWGIYHPTYNHDVFQMVQHLFFSINLNERGSLSMDSLREYFGMDKENAHKADIDVLQTAYLMIKIMRLYKKLINGDLGPKIKFSQSFASENEAIKKILQ